MSNLKHENKIILNRLRWLIDELEDCSENGHVVLQKNVGRAISLLEEYLNNDWVNKIKKESEDELLG